MNITLTIKELYRIFEAGCSQGNDEQSAYEWGSVPNQTRMEALKNEMVFGYPDPIVSANTWEAIKNELKNG